MSDSRSAHAGAPGDGPDPGGRPALERLLRVGVLLLLAGLLLWGLEADRGLEAGSLHLPEPLTVSWEALSEDADWHGLLLHAAEAPVVARVSGRPPPVLLNPPLRLRAGRAAALEIQAMEPVRLVLTAAGREEELELEKGERDAFVLRPREGGWSRWQLAIHPDSNSEDPSDEPPPEPSPPAAATEEMSPVSIPWAGWAEPARPLRILALSGPTSQEMRLALRALDEAGEAVESWTHLGRDLWIGRDPGPLPADPAAYTDYDAILLFPGLPVEPDAARAIVGAVRERGRGLLLAAGSGGSDVLSGEVLGTLGTGDWGPTIPVRGDTLSWTLPAEVMPLPGASVDARLRSFSAPSPSNPALSRASPLALGSLGRGRVGALSLTDSWRWRMEAGTEEEHRMFWGSLVDWLAGGLVHDPTVEILGAHHRVGDEVRLRVVGVPEGVGPTVAAVRVEDREIDLSRSRWTAAGLVREGAFAALDAGGRHLAPKLTDTDRFAEPAGPDGPPEPEGSLDPEGPSGPERSRDRGARSGSGVWVDEVEAAGPDPGGRLARLALASPRGGVEVASPATAVLPRPHDRMDFPWRFLLFSTLAVALGLEWLLRRRAGRA